MSRARKDEAIVLRSLRYGEADRIVQLFTRRQGRVGAIAKGVRRTRSRVGARLEPFSQVAIQLYEGRGELATVTGVDLIRSHQSLAGDTYRIAVGHIGLEAVLRLFIEHDENERAFHALARFLDLLEEPFEPAGEQPEPVFDPLVLGFQLKLLWLAGYLPHLAGCCGCGASGPLVGFAPAAGGAACGDCAGSGVIPVSADGFEALRVLLEHPLAEARALVRPGAGEREVLRVVEAVYEYHGGFRMRTLARR